MAYEFHIERKDLQVIIKGLVALGTPEAIEIKELILDERDRQDERDMRRMFGPR